MSLGVQVEERHEISTNNFTINGSHSRVYSGRTTVAMPVKERIKTLAKPKLSRSTLSYGPSLSWGNQQTMWELSSGAKNAQPSERIIMLSQPKRNLSTQDDLKPQWEYSCGRQSPIIKPTAAARASEHSNRIAELSRPKHPPGEYTENRAMFEFSCGRSSPIQEPTTAAKSAQVTKERTLQLAQPKKEHGSYENNREVQTIPTKAAMIARPTERLEQLAEAKRRPTGPFREPEWPVAPKAMKAQASERTRELSRPKGLVEGFQGNRDVQWNVGKSAKQAVATRRIEELSVPIQRQSMANLQFNTDAFKVSENALKSGITQRIEELAQPIKRGPKPPQFNILETAYPK